MPETLAPATPERGLPHNADAERTVLGAVLVDNAAFNCRGEILATTSTARPTGGSSTPWPPSAERSQPIDLVTLKDELCAVGRWRRWEAPAYLAALVDGMPRITNVEHYAPDRQGEGRPPEPDPRRQPHPPDAYGPRRRRPSSSTARRRRSSTSPRTASARASSACGDRQGELPHHRPALRSSKELVTGAAHRLRGPRREDRRPAAGRPHHRRRAPGHGQDRRSCSTSPSTPPTQTGETVGVFSLEMSKEQLVHAHALRRRPGRRAPAAPRHPQGEGLGAPAPRRYADLSEAKIFIDDTAIARRAGDARQGAPPEGASTASTWSSSTTCSSCTGRGRVENRQQEISAISRSLKALAKELDVPVIALSSSRARRRRAPDKRPQLSRPARIGRHRAGRRHRDVHLPRGAVPRRRRPANQGPRSPRSSSASSATAHGHRQARLPQGVHALREPGAGSGVTSGIWGSGSGGGVGSGIGTRMATSNQK